MTNLVAIAVTLFATNTSEFKTNVLESAHHPGAIMYYGMTNVYFLREGWTSRNPDEKWVTTVVTKEDRLGFVWMGEAKAVTRSEMVSSNTVHLRIKQEWEPVK